MQYRAFTIRPALLWALFVVCWLGTQVSGEEENSTFTGKYRDADVVVELGAPSQTDGKTVYTGTIQAGAKSFPLRAEANGNQLKGSFTSEGDSYVFEASVVGRMLVLTTANTTYRLTKAGTNPLARTAKPNPLAARPVAAPRRETAPVVAPSSTPSAAAPLRLERQSILDNATMIGGEAFGALVREDWVVEGGVAWRMYPPAPAYLVLRIGNLAHTEAWEVFPTVPFVWVEGGNASYPVGSMYEGNEVQEPIGDPASYVKRVILPRFRAQVGQPQIIATEELAKVEEAISQDTAEPGVEKRFRAARVRLEYLEGGLTMQEDIYVVLSSAYAPAVKTTLWGAERNYGFKAPKGQLEALTPVFQTLADSIKPNLQWFNRYVQLLQLLQRNRPDTRRRVDELGVYLVQTTAEVDETRRMAYERQRLAQARINASFDASVPGLVSFQNPLENQAVTLPSGYRSVWANPKGGYRLSAEPGYDPNTPADGSWQRLELKP